MNRAIGIQEWGLKDRVLEARCGQARALEELEAEIRDKLLSSIRRGSIEPDSSTRKRSSPCRMSTVAAVTACARGILWIVLYIGRVIVPSWSVRSTLGGEPVARRPALLDAISCVALPTALFCRSGEIVLRPPAGNSK